MIFFSDLDNTLIYSKRKIAGNYICVDKKEGKEISYLLNTVYQWILKQPLLTIPVSTRSLEEYQRITIHPRFSYALVANGGILLKDGQIDRVWREETLQLIMDCQSQFELAKRYLYQYEHDISSLRMVNQCYLFIKSNAQDKWIAALKDILDLQKVTIIPFDRKIYILPTLLTKGNAIKRLQHRFVELKQPNIAAGDNLFDISMLKLATTAITLDCPKMRSALQMHPDSHFYHPKQQAPIYFSEYILKLISDKLT